MFFYCISARDYGQRLNKTYPTTFRCNLFQLPSILNLIIINIQAKELPMQSVQEGRHLGLLRKQGLMGTISLQAQDPSPTNDWSTGSPNSRYKWLRGQGVVNTFGCTGSPNNLFVQPIVILQPATQAIKATFHFQNPLLVLTALHFFIFFERIAAAPSYFITSKELHLLLEFGKKQVSFT